MPDAPTPIPDQPGTVTQTETAMTQSPMTQSPIGDKTTEEHTVTAARVETPPPTRSWEIQAILAVIVVAMSLGFLFYIAVYKVYDREITLMIVPTIAAALMLVLNYFFGSSIGSARKTEQAAKQADVQTDQIAKFTNGGLH